ncbi:Short-chain dehydrogenase/reductase family 9C member 7 [Seminavis robusta]|uniref:Short-chain dehydrogenase/reductase family 9C member 7 n=1 Tax=Seminavis robusta TaxID=568900 RepID=A0A9N8DHI0_9STRA|nr:Short-chain dehydrogenase/reductase family 9C member 7 [Seminavis robusta]|eukprot:Sro130_g061950.1 Short-chain dehydrogenase/reductase family 9C member 7 (370) ;mRNA; f:61557-62762
MASMVIGLINCINDVLHVEPISILVDTLFWLLVILIGYPLAAVVYLFRMIFQVLGWCLGGGGKVDPHSFEDKEFTVFVTGCDTGFGREAVPVLTARGFTVFCGCLHKSSFQYFEDDSLAIPVQLDVTSDKSVAEAYKVVVAWLGAGSKKQRHFHALVNNAGIVRTGLVDWVKMSDFQAAMNVNFYGVLRCVKEFMPLFKKQAAEGTYSGARIVNMSSIMGMFPGGICGTPYVASKYAVDSMTENLRLEMMPYGVRVVCINPSIHNTTLTRPDTMDESICQVWNAMSPSLREDYGKSCLQAFLDGSKVVEYIGWDYKHVVRAIENGVVDNYPTSRELVGMDAKYVFSLLRMLPAGFGVLGVKVKPACMQR